MKSKNDYYVTLDDGQKIWRKDQRSTNFPSSDAVQGHIDLHSLPNHLDQLGHVGCSASVAHGGKTMDGDQHNGAHVDVLNDNK